MIYGELSMPIRLHQEFPFKNPLICISHIWKGEEFFKRRTCEGEHCPRKHTTAAHAITPRCPYCLPHRFRCFPHPPVPLPPLERTKVLHYPTSLIIALRSKPSLVDTYSSTLPFSFTDRHLFFHIYNYKFLVFSIARTWCAFLVELVARWGDFSFIGFSWFKLIFGFVGRVELFYPNFISW